MVIPDGLNTLVPVGEANRIRMIDALRGVALLGILAMNIPEFSMPNYYAETFQSDPKQFNFWLNAFISILLEGKMRALFGMVFGAGILLFVSGKEASGKSVTRLFYRRMGWLMLFGLIHAHMVLWIGDILYLYSICGVLVFLLRKVEPKYLAMALPLVALVDFGAGAFFYQNVRAKRLAYVEARQVEAEKRTLTAAHQKALAEWREIEKTMIPNREDAKENTRKMKGDYGSVAGYLRPLAFKLQTTFLALEVSDSVALMLLGMALYRWGFFTGSWAMSTYWKIAGIGYGIGLPLVSFSFYYDMVHFPTLEADLLKLERMPVNWVGAIYPFQRILLVLAHAAAIILMHQSGVLEAWFSRLEAVGRMAFTNYILHSLICTLFFFGYGLNFYAELDFYQIYFVVLAIWALQVLSSPLWLKYFYFGPLEWLWRSLTYWNPQPMRRST